MSVKMLFILVTILAALWFIATTTTNEGMTNPTPGKCPNLLVQKGSKIFLYNTRLAEVPGVNPISFNTLEEYTEFLDWQKSQGIVCPVLYLQQIYDASGKLVCKTRPCTSEPQGGLPPTNATTDTQTTAFSEKNAVGASGVNSVSGMSGGDGVSGANSGVTGADDISGVPLLPGQMPETDPSSLSINPSGRYPNLERVKLLDAVVDDPPFNQDHYPAHDPSPFYQGVHTPLDEMDVQNEAKKRSPNAMDPNWGGKPHTQSLIDTGYYKENEVYIY